jgi:hypothetical protein
MLLEAFDVSSWQAADLGNLSRYRMGIARATYGLGNAETTYAQHITQIAAGGRAAGAYHAGVDTNGAAQADFLLAHVKSVTVQPSFFMIDTREFGMTVAECNAFILTLRTLDTLHRPILIYDSEGNWQTGYVGHDGDAIANYLHMPVRPFVYWQNAPSGGPAGGDHGWVDPIWLDRLGVGRKALLWTDVPDVIQIIVKKDTIIYQLDGRTRYSIAGSDLRFQKVGTAPGWRMILDGKIYAAVRA